MKVKNSIKNLMEELSVIRKEMDFIETIKFKRSKLYESYMDNLISIEEAVNLYTSNFQKLK